MEGGDPILCNAIIIFELSKTLTDGKTPYERRFGESFKGPITPFGVMVEYHPSSPKDQVRIHQFGQKVLRGTFFGYELIAVGNLERKQRKY